MRRKRMRRYRPRKQNSGVKFVWFIAIILGAVICGYLTARFLMGPLLGYDTQVLKLDFPSKMTGLLQGDDDEKQDSKEQKEQQEEQEEQSEEESGYCLQFGAFSTEDGAKELKEQLEKDGIETLIRKEAKQYKVVSETFSSKEKALNRLENLKEKKNIDVFIAAVD